jgi:tetratricopeptide (TPR) repeat protein
MASHSSRSNRRRRLLVGAVFVVLTLIAAEALVLRREARVRWAARLPNSALHTLQRAFPGDPVPRLTLAQRHRWEGRPDRALEILEPLIEASPDFHRAHGEYAHALADAGRDLEAFNAAQNVLLDHPNTTAALAAMARMHGMRGDWLQALQRARDVLDKEAWNADAWLVLAQGRAAQEDWGPARDAARRALAGNPAASEARVVLSQAALALGDAEEAVRQAELAVELAAGSAAAYGALGEALLAVGQDLDRAQAAFEEALSRAADNPTFQIGIARALLAQKKIRESLAPLGAALELSPEANEARALLAKAHEALGEAGDSAHWRRERDRWEDFLQRKADLLREAASTPYGYKPRFELAELYLLMDLPERAREEVEQGLQRGPDPEGVALKARIEALVGRRNERNREKL